MQTKNICLLILLLVICSIWLHCAAPIWQKVDLALRQGNPQSAERQVEEHLRSHPNDAKAYYALGEIRAEMDNWQEMTEAFAASERADARWKRDTDTAKEFHWTANFNAGLDVLQQREFVRAINHFKNCIIILPGHAIAHRLLGEAILASGDTALAQPALVKTLELDEKDQWARRHLLMIYFSTGNYRSAILEAEVLMEEFLNDLEAHRIRAYSFDRLNEKHQALTAYQQLIGLSSHAADYESFAAFKYRLGDFEAALRLSRQSIQRGGSRFKNLKAVAQCQLMQQNFRDLSETAQDILEISNTDNTNISALQLLQISYMALGRTDEAKAITTKIEQITQKQP